MHYKLIAIDVDGTLLSPAGEVTPRTVAAVQRTVKAGVKICLATGRNFTETQPILEKLNHYDDAVFVGGAVIFDTANKRTIHRTLMDASLARELSAFFEIRKHAVLAIQDHTEAGLDYLITEAVEPSASTVRWLKETKATSKRIPDLAQYAHPHTVRISIVAKADEIQRIFPELEQTFGSTISCHYVAVPGHDWQIVEVFDPNVSKWKGIRRLADVKGIAPKDIIAIGDDVNDLSMITHAGLGVAMGNAHPRIKAIAKKVIGPNSEDGLAEFLEKLI